MPTSKQERPSPAPPGEVPAVPQTGGLTLTATVGKNTVFGVIARVVQAATRLVTVPIVIAHLGLGGYGIWAIIMTVAAYMRFGSIGVKSAFQKYVAEATGKGNYERANQLLSTGTTVLLVISCVGLAPISLLSRQLAKAAGVPPEFLGSAAHAISMLAVIMLLSNFGAAFEAIVMGGHRIDLARKFTTFFTVAEAVAIIIVLHFGYGLFAMAVSMGISEVGFVGCCYIAAKKVVPEIEIGRKYITRTVLHELLRYAGSYQLVNIMEVIYAAIVPIAFLRVFGDESAGVYALAYRLQASALMLPDAFLLPILSGGTLGLTVLPLAFLAVFGNSIVYVWTGQSPHSLQATLWLLCATGFFYSLSILGLVLYRSSGHALHDNIRQALRIVMLFCIALSAPKLGYLGILAGLMCTEMAGMVFMLFAITKTYPGFHPKSLLPQTLNLIVASVATLAVGFALGHLPLHILYGPRVLATVRLTLAILGCALAVGPALWITDSVTSDERKALFRAVVPRRFRTA